VTNLLIEKIENRKNREFTRFVSQMKQLTDPMYIFWQIMPSGVTIESITYIYVCVFIDILSQSIVLFVIPSLVQTRFVYYHNLSPRAFAKIL
jgi:hypothetical protein